MRTLELEEMDLVELSDFESEELNAGWLDKVIGIVAAGIYVYNNWDDFTSGFRAGQAAYHK